MFLESTLYPSHVREILFLGSCLIHDFPMSETERVDRVALSRRSTLRFIPLSRGKCRARCTLYRGCIDAFNFHECTGRFPLRHATIFMIQWAKRTVDKISFRYTCFETTIRASFTVHHELLLLVCCCVKRKKKKLNGFLIRLVSPCTLKKKQREDH